MFLEPLMWAIIRIPFISPTIRNFTGLPAPRPEGRFSPSLRGSSPSRIRSDPAGFAAYSIGVRIILQVLLGVGFGLLCAYLSWGGPRDPDAADLVPAPEPAHSAVAAPQRVRHDTHFS